MFVLSPLYKKNLKRKKILRIVYKLQLLGLTGIKSSPRNFQKGFQRQLRSEKHYTALINEIWS